VLLVAYNFLIICFLLHRWWRESWRYCKTCRWAIFTGAVDELILTKLIYVFQTSDL